MTELKTISALLALLILGACVSNTPAPVETRSPAQAAPAASSAAASSAPSAPAQPRPGYYIVKKGDTLYSIALEHGSDYRELASWNNLDNPSLILVGQELRVLPPGATPATVDAPGTTRPVAVPRFESRPADALSAPLMAPPPKQDNGIVSEPRGGRLAYSEKAWRELLAQSEPRVDARPPLAASVPAAASDAKAQPPKLQPPAAASAPVLKAPPAASAPLPAPAVESAKGGDDKPDWSWPARGKVITSFNDSSSKGIDIAGSVGDPVYAAASGKVIYVGSDLRAYGNLVIIKHGTQFTTVYAHNKEILVKEQQQVQKGQKIAVMGDSDADRPKLHFELRQLGGKPVDPIKYLPTR